MKTPFQHQVTGADWLASRGFGILADEPGAGKTAQVVMAADAVGARNILVICPAVVRPHWQREFRDWQKIDRQVDLVEGRPKERPKPGVTIISHATLADEKRSMHLICQTYDLIVVDEIHMFRQMDAIRTRMLLAPDGMWTWAPRLWGLTGTPLVNSAADLWPLTWGPLRAGIPWFDWGMQFAESMNGDGYGGIRPLGIKNANQLAAWFRPHILRRTLAGIGVVLPQLTVKHQLFPIPDDAMQRIMADLEGWTPDRLIQAIEEKDDLRDSAMARVRKTLGLAKLNGVAHYVNWLIEHRMGPAVVFFQHTSVREELFNQLAKQYGHRVSWIDGKITPKQLEAAESWFQRGDLDILLVQTDAGGMGLTLTRAARVVIAELPWTSVGMWQAIKRVHRITQIQPVHADIVRAKGIWLEEVLASTISKKHFASEQFLRLIETTN